MEEDILLNCGKYSEELSEATKKILIERKLNGEKITRNTVEEVKSEIYQAYQMILNNVKAYKGQNSSVLIDNSVNSLINIIRTQGVVSEIVNVADTISKNEVVVASVNKNDSFIQNQSRESAILVASIINDEENTLVTNMVYGSQLINNINELYEKATLGKTEDTANIAEIERLTKFMSTHSKLDDKSLRGLSALMMRAASLENDVVNDTLKEVARHYDIDIFSTDGEKNGKSIDLSKLEKLYQTSVGTVNAKAAKRTLADFKNLAYESAKGKITQKEYVGKNKDIESFEKGVKERSKYIGFFRKINQAYKEKRLDVIEKNFRSNQQYATMVVNDILSWQQNSIKPKRRDELVSQGLILGNILSQTRLSMMQESLPTEKKECKTIKSEPDDFVL